MISIGPYFCPLWLTKYNQVSQSRTLCSTHYTGEPSHLDLGRGALARARWLRKNLIPGKVEKVTRLRVFLTKTKNSGKTLARSSFVLKDSVHIEALNANA